MIQKEFYGTRSDGADLYRSYSDKGVKLQKIGTDEIYDEAVDVENSGYKYEETDMPIDGDEATETDYQNALEDLGVNFNEENDVE